MEPRWRSAAAAADVTGKSWRSPSWSCVCRRPPGASTGDTSKADVRGDIPELLPPATSSICCSRPPPQPFIAGTQANMVWDPAWCSAETKARWRSRQDDEIHI